MARFQFRLRTLRRLRELHRDQMRIRLAQANEAEQILLQQRRSLADEFEALRRSQRQLCERSVLDVSQALQSQRYQMLLQAQGEDMSQQLQRVRQEVEQRRLAVVDADRLVRILDKLEERQRVEHQRTEAIRDVKRLDEIGASRRGEGL